MSNYGSKTNSEGKSIQANGSMPVLVGECVPGNTIEYFGMSKDQNGELSANMAEIRFKQSNGATFTKKFWDSEEDWAIDNLNRDMLHIATKIVPETEYDAAVAGSTSFSDFIQKIAVGVISKAEGKKFALKIIYKANTNKQSASFGQFFPSFPNFPNWIEPDGTNPTTFRTNPKYDFYEIPTSTSAEEMDTEEAADTEVF